MLLGLFGEAVLIDGQVYCPRVSITDTIYDFDPASKTF
jgi:hypothetical protein